MKLVEAGMGRVTSEQSRSERAHKKVSSTSGNIWQNLKCKHFMIHKFHLQKFMVQKFVLLGANMHVNLIGSWVNGLGLRPGSATVNETPVKCVMTHIGLQKVLSELKHSLGFEQYLAHGKVSMCVSYY